MEAKLTYKRKKIPTQCAWCGEELMREQSEINRNKNSFCNHVCYGAYSSKYRSGKNSPGYLHDKARDCIECGKPISKGSKSGLCKSCAKKGERSYQWKGGISTFLKQIRNLYEYKTWMRIVKERDQEICQHCGVDEHIEVHHIKELKDIVKDNDITTIEEAKTCAELWDTNNGKCLCVHCHAEEHPDMRKAILLRAV